MKYKIGDKVRIRQWDDMVEEFGVDGGDILVGGCCFVEEMKQYCGKVFEIYDVWSFCYNLKTEDEELDWNFTEGMFEDVDFSPSLGISLLFSEMDYIRFEFRDNKIFMRSKTLTYIERGKEMKKQMTQRERLEEQLKNYQRDSDIKSIEIIVPGKIVKVTMNDYSETTLTMKCHKDDTFSLEKAIILAYIKYRSGRNLTPEGIEYEAERFSHYKTDVKKLKKAMKVYEIQQKLKELDDEEAIIRERKRQKKIAQKQRKAKRLAEEKLEETKEAAKIYAEALKSAFSDCDISEDTVENIVKDMNVRM